MDTPVYTCNVEKSNRKKQHVSDTTYIQRKKYIPFQTPSLILLEKSKWHKTFWNMKIYMVFP